MSILLDRGKCLRGEAAETKRPGSIRCPNATCDRRAPKHQDLSCGRCWGGHPNEHKKQLHQILSDLADLAAKATRTLRSSESRGSWAVEPRQRSTILRNQGLSAAKVSNQSLRCDQRQAARAGPRVESEYSEHTGALDANRCVTVLETLGKRAAPPPPPGLLSSQ